MNKIVAICGPKDVGKTVYSIEIAKKFDGDCFVRLYAAI